MDDKTIVPPVLYVPVRRDGQGSVEVITMPMDNGGAALLAYTALDRLAKGCGAGQAWVTIFTSTLSTVKEESPFDALAFDVEFPGGLAKAMSS
ncbi:SAV_915 family protein [Demequina aurantiaca]|uniref:SAV_915 family protein n=1 Tax=Demequina aurantiaca TaxID=676200 RepID=UPI0007832BAD|nr:SAV_915 family protein [Demequina aurantiaca]